MGTLDSSSTSSIPLKAFSGVLQVSGKQSETLDGIDLFKNIFPRSSDSEIKEIYSRMEGFAKECNISTNEMIVRVLKGHKIAEKIVQGDSEHSHSTNDVINLDWFMRAQMAKMDKL